MEFFTYRIVSIAIFLMCLTRIGSGLRVVTQPQPFAFSTEELNISCIVDEPAYMTKSILSLQISRHIEDKAIAVINVAQVLKMSDGSKNNVKAEGHIDTKSNKSYLTLIIDKPGRQDAGTYRCQMIYIDENLQIAEKNIIGNATYQESDITGVVTYQARKLSNLMTRFLKQNNTLHTLKKQHTAFKHLHSQQKLDMDILNDKINTQNNTITGQKKQEEELRQKQKLDMDILNDKINAQNNTITEEKKQEEELRQKQKLDMDILNDKINTQNNTITEQKKQEEELRQKQKLDMDILKDEMKKMTKQIDTLNKDNTQKQQQLDVLMDYITQQNATNKKIQKSVLQTMTSQGWKYYETDKTFIKAFGKNDNSKRLSWSEAREACQSLGGDLVQIHDGHKNNFVYYLFDNMCSTWIGLKNHARSGFNFKYLDGSDLGSYHPWDNGAPSGGNNDCVFMYTSVGDAGEWQLNSCSYKLCYTCSVPLNVL